MRGFALFGTLIPGIFIGLAKHALMKEVGVFLLQDSAKNLGKSLRQLSQNGVHVNFNYLGEDILGKHQSQERFEHYETLIRRGDIHTLSVKLSAIIYPINLIDWDTSVAIAVKKLGALLHTTIQAADPGTVPTFIYLDMESYAELEFTATVFKTTLAQPEFKSVTAGIALQAYIPDSLSIQKSLTQWAIQRAENGGAPIKIRLVKGANMGMETVSAGIMGWPLATHSNKIDTDAQFKRMLLYGLRPQHITHVHLGIGSHNLFDIAYAMLERAERGVEPYVSFEFLYGISEPLQKLCRCWMTKC